MMYIKFFSFFKLNLHIKFIRNLKIDYFNFAEQNIHCFIFSIHFLFLIHSFLFESLFTSIISKEVYTIINDGFKKMVEKAYQILSKYVHVYIELSLKNIFQFLFKDQIRAESYNFGEDYIHIIIYQNFLLTHYQ